MPFDVPGQSPWMSGTTSGYASYHVADWVTSHEAWGVGVYSYLRDAVVKATSASPRETLAYASPYAFDGDESPVVRF
jgi:hypothetical protein